MGARWWLGRGLLLACDTFWVTISIPGNSYLICFLIFCLLFGIYITPKYKPTDAPNGITSFPIRSYTGPRQVQHKIGYNGKEMFAVGVQESAADPAGKKIYIYFWFPVCSTRTGRNYVYALISSVILEHFSVVLISWFFFSF